MSAETDTEIAAVHEWPQQCPHCEARMTNAYPMSETDLRVGFAYYECGGGWRHDTGSRPQGVKCEMRATNADLAQRLEQAHQALRNCRSFSAKMRRRCARHDYACYCAAEVDKEIQRFVADVMGPPSILRDHRP